jgi:hypothetical protein
MPDPFTPSYQLRPLTQRRFLEVLVQTSCIKHACAIVFVADWSAAVNMSIQHQLLEESAIFERAIS